MEIVEQPAAPKKERKSRRKINMRGAFSRRRKILILTGMFVLLIVTGYLNFTLNNNNNTQVGGGGSGTILCSFDHAQRTREVNRQVQIISFENLLASELTQDERSQVVADKQAWMQAMEFENQTENLIRAQGHDDVVVQKNRENINVMVRTTGTLTQNEVTQIQMIIDSVANRTVNIENIVIMPIPPR